MALCLQHTFLRAFYVFMCLSLVQVLCEPVRYRRETPPTYVIDVHVVVDDVMFARWTQWIKDNTNETAESEIKNLTEQIVKEYVSLTFHQANVRLSSLKSHLGYDVILQVVNVTTNENVLGSAPNVDAEKGLETFRNWTINRGIGSRFDHAVLMTSKYLQSSGYESSTFSLKGRAYVANMCNQDGNSASIVEDRGGFLSAYIIAHEVAHSLGAKHDGESSTISCPATDYYIMTALGLPTSPAIAERPWYFSKCSASDINTIVGSILSTVSSPNKTNCLLTSGVPIQEFNDTKSVIPGQRYPPSKQCQMMHGKDSRVCPDLSSLDNICTSMYCLLPGTTNYCTKNWAAEGTSCGNKKWCSKGRCVGSDAAPEIGDCYLGDNITTIIVNNESQTCSMAIRSTPSLCYQSDVRTQCCASCKAIERSDPACKYGDSKLGCKSNYCTPKDVGNFADCCGTCETKPPQNLNNSRSTGSNVLAVLPVTLLTCLRIIINPFN